MCIMYSPIYTVNVSSKTNKIQQYIINLKTHFPWAKYAYLYIWIIESILVFANLNTQHFV